MGSENVRYFGMSWVKMSCACNQRVLRRVVCLSQACRMPQSCAVLIGPGVIVNRIIFFSFGILGLSLRLVKIIWCQWRTFSQCLYYVVRRD